MANEKSASDVCTSPLTPIVNANFENGKYHIGSASGGGENVEYTLKPAMRAYASTARYIYTHMHTLHIFQKNHFLFIYGISFLSR